MMEELKIGQVIHLRRRHYDEGPSERYRKEPYVIVQICKDQIIVEDKRGIKRGVSAGELIVMGIIKQNRPFEELRENRNDMTDAGKRGRYRSKS